MRKVDNHSRGLLLVLVSSLVAIWLPRDQAGAGSPARPVKIGVVATLAPGMPTSLLAIAMRPFRSYMEEQTGAQGEIVRGGDAFDLGRQLRDDRIQVGIFHGHEFAWARENYPTLEPIVVCINPMRSVRACLVAGPKSSATTTVQLQGQSIALPRDARDHCRLFFEQRCVAPGVEPARFFGRIARPSDTVDALDDVAAGRVQAAVVDAVALERYRRSNATRARQVRLMQQSEAFPPGIIACDRERMGPVELKKLREALVQAKDHPRGRQTLQMLKLATFEPAADDLDTALKTIARAYPAPRK